MLEKVYDNIRNELEHTSFLEDSKVTVGAVPYIASVLYHPLSPYEQIVITDRIHGAFTVPSKRKKEVKLGKIIIGNEVCGVEVIRQFDDCRCIKKQGCDMFEAGSILFSKMMCTGFTNRDEAYKESLGVFSGNCNFRFHRHLPSKPLKDVVSIFYANDIIPYSAGGIKGMVAFINDLKQGKRPRPVKDPLKSFLLEAVTIDPILEKIDFAVYCARLIVDAYALARKNVLTASLHRLQHLQKSLWKRTLYRLQKIEDYCPECFEQDIRIRSFNQKLEYYSCNECGHKWTRKRKNTKR